MYIQVKTDKSVISNNGMPINPIVTLVNDSGEKCQISIEGSYYKLYLSQNDGTYKPTSYIFDGVFEVLKKLPLPTEYNKILNTYTESVSENTKEFEQPLRAECISMSIKVGKPDMVFSLAEKFYSYITKGVWE